jgi:acyl-CoA reductase-like NAD-dependent aldehyde dehydrogenase
MAAIRDLLALDALGPVGPYQAHERQTITDVAGDPLAELSLVPRLFVTRAMAALRKADTLPVDERLAALARAGELHATGTVDGVPATDHQFMVSRACGMPITFVRSAAEAIRRSAAQAYDSLQHARPAGAVNDWRDPLTRTGRAVWTRRGNVFAVHAPGNHPGVHSFWLEALMLGYRVAVRPSRRDPFTPHRLISALRMGGFGDDQVVLLPTGYDAADAILHGADLAMVYGGEEVMRKYAVHPAVLPQGPGRSKILLTADADWREHLDVIVDSISHESGRPAGRPRDRRARARALPARHGRGHRRVARWQRRGRRDGRRQRHAPARRASAPSARRATGRRRTVLPLRLGRPVDA